MQIWHFLLEMQQVCQIFRDNGLGRQSVKPIKNPSMLAHKRGSRCIGRAVLKPLPGQILLNWYGRNGLKCAGLFTAYVNIGKRFSFIVPFWYIEISCSSGLFYFPLSLSLLDELA
jgi:hypothetical protein